MFRGKALLLGLFCCSVLASPAQAGYEESTADSFRGARWLVPMDGQLGSPFGPVFRGKALLLGLFCCSDLASPAQAGYEESPADSHREARWLVPMDGPLGSPFGPRWGRLHEGIDIEGWAETRVRAAQTGVVTHVGWLSRDSGHGLVVKVRHEGRIVTMYAHLARAFVKEGQTVTARQIIGRAGCTGFCTGTHLHFQVWRRGDVIDPLILLGRHAFDEF